MVCSVVEGACGKVMSTERLVRLQPHLAPLPSFPFSHSGILSVLQPQQALPFLRLVLTRPLPAGSSLRLAVSFPTPLRVSLPWGHLPDPRLGLIFLPCVPIFPCVV